MAPKIQDGGLTFLVLPTEILLVWPISTTMVCLFLGLSFQTMMMIRLFQTCTQNGKQILPYMCIAYSCQTTLFNMIEHFKRSLDNGEYVACLSMDLSKAFDCLPHCLTICKLHSYCVSREACTLIASYLRDLKQRIKLGNSRSEWTELFKGVPQGSILAPLIL